MNRETKVSHKRATVLCVIDLLFYIGIALMFGMILWYGQPVFAINDDLGLYNVLSGAFTGSPSAYVSYMEFPLSWSLSMLYRLCGSVPWYGIFLEGMLLICAMVGYHRCTALLRKKEMSLLLAVIMRGIFCAAWLGMSLIPMLRLQYTVVAAVCGATALFLFVTSEDTESTQLFLKQNIGTICLALLAESIRPEMMLMLLGFAGVMWFGRLCYRVVVEKKYGLYIKRYIWVLGIFGIGLGLILLSSHFAYRDVGWRYYREVDRCRVQMFDYYGYPSYDGYKEYFEAHDIDRATYEAVADLHMYPGRDLSPEQWAAMAELAETVYEEENSLGDRLGKVFPLWNKWLQDAGIRPVNQIMILAYAVCLLLILICKSREGGLLFMCVLAARLIGWTVLVYRGRCPDRIAMSIFWMEFALLSGIMLKILASSVQQIKLRVCMPILVVVGLLLGYWDVEELYRVRKEYHTGQKEIWDELKAYCHLHGEQLYICSGGSNTIYYYYDTPFENLTQYENYIPLSSSHMMNPNTEAKLAEWGITDLMDAIITDERVYLIFEEGKFGEQNTLVKYYHELYDNFEYELIEMFEAGTITYQVYQFHVEM